MVLEMRTYRIMPGQRERWIEFMEGEIIPFFVSHGNTVLGSFLGTEEEDLYIWIRRFDSEAERERVRTAVRESSHWRDNIAPVLPELIDTADMQSTWLEPTAKSVMR